MTSNVHFLKVEKTARVVSSKPSDSFTSIWLIAHGYGYLATYFIDKFKSMNTDENYLVIPEGLHRYYLNGVSGRVGASWMTKEEREKDIEDYCNYLDKVYINFISPFSGKVTVNALGFSQGGATICRWAANTRFRIDNLIVWGSVIPPDMNWEEDLVKLKRPNWIYVAGSDDEFLNAQQQNEQIGLLNKFGIRPDVINYAGKHEIQADALRLLTEKCVKKNS